MTLYYYEQTPPCNTIRYIIKQIKKSHCNGATAEYAKYSQFEYKEAFCENDLVSIVFKNNDNQLKL